MTATAAEEEHQDPEAKLSGRERLLAAYLEAYAAADDLLRQVISAELAEGLPALEEADEKAAALHHEAWQAAQGPQQDVARIDAELAEAERDRARWQALLTDDTPREERARARFQLAEVERDVSRLQQKRDLASEKLQQLQAALTKAKAAKETTAAAIAGRKLNADPALAYYGAGQKTSAYGFRFGLALTAALQAEDHPEHDAAVDFMVQLCASSGFRTERYADRLPNDAEQGRAFWDQVFRDANPSAGAPSGREVIEQYHARMTAQQMNSPIQTPDQTSPRPAPQRRRSYMEPPARVKDML